MRFFHPILKNSRTSSIFKNPLNTRFYSYSAARTPSQSQVIPITKSLQFVTDVEGDIDYFKKQIRNSEIVQFSNSEENILEFKSIFPNEYFVFGGDVCDRGYDITIIEMLIRFKLAYPERVMLVVGNRDLNKTRFSTELPLDPNEKWDDNIEHVVNPEHATKSYRRYLYDAALKNTPVTRLKWILSCTMGAPAAFECRRKELENRHCLSEVSDEMVYQSFRQSIEPNGFMRKFLMLAQLGAIIGDTIIFHGGITANNMGKVPNGFVAFEKKPGIFFHSNKSLMLTYGDVHEWVAKLNHWYVMAIHRWINTPFTSSFYRYSHDTPASPLQHMAMGSGSFFHNKTPVVGNFLKNPTTPWPISETVEAFLRKGGIHRVLAGHKPSGNTPLVLLGAEKKPVNNYSFQVFTCDTSYGNYDVYDPHYNGIYTENSRGTSFATTHVFWNGKSSRVSIKGTDSFNIPYEKQIYFPRDEKEDIFIGRVVKIEDKYYTVRINFSGNYEKPYVLTHMAKDHSIKYLYMDANELFELENKEAFLTPNGFLDEEENLKKFSLI